MSSSSKGRILDAAAELFGRLGYHGTSIEQISQSVGLGRGALYHHIRSKEDLLYELSLSVFRSITDDARAVAEGDLAPDEKLTILGQQIIAHPASRNNAWTVALQNAHVLTDDHRAEIVEARKEYERQWASVLAQGAVAGLWRTVSDVELRGILGMFNSTARWVRLDGALSPAEISQTFLGLILHGIHQG